MRNKGLIAGIILLIAAYVAYPYLALHRLGDAVRRSDVAAVDSKVDWPALRRCEISPSPMHRGVAQAGSRTSKRIVVTELGGNQNPDHMSESGISSKWASHVSPSPP